MERLISWLNELNISFELNCSLKNKTWIHRGGTAGIYITPNDRSQLYQVSKFLFENGIEFLLVGHTSNLYILNTTNIDIVVSTVKCKSYTVKDSSIDCDAGVSVIKLSRDMVSCGIKGFEYLTGLPGTVAAALYNNSSCHTGSISGLLISADVVLSDGTLRTFSRDDFDFKFRSSVFKERRLKGVIISVILKAEKGSLETLQAIAHKNALDRKRILEGHAYNLGCTVNRPFINGKMPVLINTLNKMFNLAIKYLPFTDAKKAVLRRNFICDISGYGCIKHYISPKNPIIFMWTDGRADSAFPIYIEFMRKVYKTDKVEIEVIEESNQ